MSPCRRQACLIGVAIGVWAALSLYHYFYSQYNRTGGDFLLMNAIGEAFVQVCFLFVLVVIVLSLLGRLENWLRKKYRKPTVSDRTKSRDWGR
jgi:hypothetical protein